MTDFEGLLRALAEAGVEYILVGGLAARAHGAARSTQDVDVVYLRDEANLERLVRALAPLEPYLRVRRRVFRFGSTCLRCVRVSTSPS